MNIFLRRTISITSVAIAMAAISLGILYSFDPLKNSYSNTELFKEIAEIPNFKIVSEKSLGLDLEIFPLLYRLNLMVFGYKTSEDFTVKGVKVESNVGNRNRSATELRVIQTEEKQFCVKIQVLEQRACYILIMSDEDSFSDAKGWMRVVKNKYPMIGVRSVLDS